MIYSKADRDVQEQEDRIMQLKVDLDLALDTTGQEKRAADLSETLSLEERLLEDLKRTAAPKKPLAVVAGYSHVEAQQ
jgi:hypothetical protein